MGIVGNFRAHFSSSFPGRAPKDKGKDQQGLLKEREAAEGNCHTKYNESPIKMHEMLKTISRMLEVLA